VAVLGLLLLGPGFLAILAGLLWSNATVISFGGALTSLGGLTVVGNLSVGPLRAMRLPPTPAPSRRRPDAPRPTAVTQ
jgi:hypothetical protein